VQLVSCVFVVFLRFSCCASLDCVITVCWPHQRFFVVASAPQLYYLHPDVSFFKGDGFKALGPYLDMPDNSAAGDVWNPPDTESTSGISYDNCEA